MPSLLRVSGQALGAPSPQTALGRSPGLDGLEFADALPAPGLREWMRALAPFAGERFARSGNLGAAFFQVGIRVL